MKISEFQFLTINSAEKLAEWKAADKSRIMYKSLGMAFWRSRKCYNNTVRAIGNKDGFLAIGDNIYGDLQFHGKNGAWIEVRHQYLADFLADFPMEYEQTK